MEPAFTACLICILLITGCASQNTVTAPTPSEVAWANQVLENESKLKAQETELARVKAEMEQAKVEAEKVKADLAAEKKMQEEELWLNENTDKVTAALKDWLKPRAVKNMEVFGFQGTLLDYDLDNVVCKNGVLYFNQYWLMQKDNLSGELAVTITGLEIKNYKTVCCGVVTNAYYTPMELKKYLNDNYEEAKKVNGQLSGNTGNSPVNWGQSSENTTSRSASAQSQESPGFYERNKTDIDRAVISVGAVGLTAIIKNMIDSAFSDQ